MTAEELLKAGDTRGALEALQDTIRKEPQVAQLRIFLFQLLCVRADWDRAIRQLKLCAELSAEALPMAQTYREAIICEVYRDKVFTGDKAPLIFGEPQEWVALLIEALKPLAAGDAAAAAGVRATAFDAAPQVSGTINGKPFEWIADADMRFGPILEIIVNGRYFWAPFDTIHKLEFEEPGDLRDKVWTATTVTWANGGQTVALIPSRYPGITGDSDDRRMLGRETDWVDVGSETFVGHGQRVLTTDQEDIALMDVREIVIGDPPEDTSIDMPDDVKAMLDSAIGQAMSGGSGNG